MSDFMFVKKKVKELAKAKKMKVSSSLYETLNRKVEQIINEAAERAKANKRTTIKARDI